jgi:hypothetical protein
MDFRRRFVFRGNASAFGGRIVRPHDVTFEMPGASSIPVSGGRSVAAIPQTSFRGFVTFERAATLAEGLIEDRQAALDLSNHKISEDSVVTATRARAEIHGLTVNLEQRFKVRRAVAELKSQSPLASGEPRVSLGDAALEGVTIDGFKLDIDIEHDIFRRYNTRAALLVAADERDFVRKHGRHFFMNAEFAGRAAPATGRFVPGCDPIYSTIVKSISWDGPPNPRARIDGHSVVVDDFGKIFFGELLISAYSRRLTMMRFELGSDEGGGAGGPDVDVNGGWYP